LTLKKFCGIKEEKFAGFFSEHPDLGVECLINPPAFIFE